MALYSYEAFSKEGKRVQGVIDASSVNNAKEQLTRQGLYPISISSASGAQQGLLARLLPSGISLKTKILFTKQLAVLLRSGVPILQAFDLLIDQFEGRMQSIIVSIRDAIKEGVSLADALKNYPKIFDTIYVQLVRAGEASGKLEVILMRLVEYMERRQEVRRKIRSAVQYPIIQFVIIVLILVAIINFVIPQFQPIFELYGDRLPTPAAILLGLSNFFQRHYLLLFVGIGLLTFGVFSWVRSVPGKRTLDAIKVKLPVIKYVTKTSAVVQFCYTFGILLEGGVNLAQALDIVCSVIDNRTLADSLMQARDKIIKQGRIAQYLQETGMFPPMAIYLIRTGEESGQLDAMLLNVAKQYEEDLKELIDGATGLINPIMLLFMGAVVGFIILAIMGPIMSVNDVLELK